jgi:hypothetical protein
MSAKPGILKLLYENFFFLSILSENGFQFYHRKLTRPSIFTTIIIRTCQLTHTVDDCVNDSRPDPAQRSPLNPQR